MSTLRPMTDAELKAVKREILGEVADFCEEVGIRYYLWAGTLLGAVRHRGYVPWDDDLDLAMPRADYERFCRDFAASPSSLELYAPGVTAGYFMPFAKVGDRRTLVIEDSDTAIPIGANIDIYPIDGWPDGRVALRLHDLWLRLLSWLRLVKSLRPQPDWGKRKSLLLRVAKAVLVAMPMRAILDALQHASTRADPTTARQIGVTVDTPSERVPREAYGEPVELEFEGRLFSAPEGWDCVLRTLYDDYMALPPESERVSHHAFKAYWVGTAA